MENGGQHGKEAHILRKEYAKYILGNRINPQTKGAINGRFMEAYTKARQANEQEVTMGDTLGGLTPRHTRIKKAA